MKAVKIIGILILVYIGIIVAFESAIGYYQPSNQGTLVISTTDEDGATNDRVLARIESSDQLYVAANHWPRAWYSNALENRNVQVDLGEGKKDYLVVPIEDDEQGRVDSENSLPLVFKILTGFPPRYIIRLDPR
ncbi:MAG: hypothetical protein QGH99_01510 [Pseudomonadales bacterium]|jgi:hypothetical protein|nr:hypothetical protein [Gammaproteobacteria bacterium]MDP6025547.1 hypothetical protein [Pseudomonadales bacterium]MDP6315169.1 hypothetical protein [Pseudomonadales bacterium]MDP7314412.1 hypothetical protein [Pseudomonadales bacterium]MDP7575612.1 hypothetical protein [Pseudomonadales bacterium]|tara:strand:+ start:11008 stop:11409 length:402 start_codon:yes stop_codon:yes gene_type:complete